MAGGHGGDRRSAAARAQREQRAQAMTAVQADTARQPARAANDDTRQAQLPLKGGSAPIPVKVSHTHIAMAMQKPGRALAINPFQPVRTGSTALHPPGFRPHHRDQDQMAMDRQIDTVASWANVAYTSAWLEGQTFMGYPYLSELALRPEYRTFADVMSTEATRKWIKLEGKSRDLDKTEPISELADYMGAMKVVEAFRGTSMLDSLFGRGHIYLDTGATDNPDELLQPIGTGWDQLSASKVNPKNPLRRVSCIEPVWTYPQEYNSSDPLQPDFYKPQSWMVQAKRVHASRLLTFVSREVPDLYKPAFSFGGLAMSQMAKPYVDNWLRTRQSVSDVTHAFSVFALSTNMGAMLQMGSEEFIKRAQLFNLVRDNRGLMMLDKDTEELKNHAVPLGTLDMLQAQAQEHMASVSRIPLIKLLGISPHGLNASSEGEIRTFYDTIAAYQEHLFRQHLHRVIGFCMLSLWGKVDPDITFSFESLWSLDEKGEAEVRKLDAETGKVLIDGGVIDPAEERARVGTAADTPYQGLDIDDVPEPPADEGEGGDGEGGGKDGPAEGPETSEDEDPFPFALDWNEADHPRGQPGNAGQFGPGGGGTSSAPAKTHKQSAEGLRAGIQAAGIKARVKMAGTSGSDKWVHVDVPRYGEVFSPEQAQKIAAFAKEAGFTYARGLPINASTEYWKQTKGTPHFSFVVGREKAAAAPKASAPDAAALYKPPSKSADQIIASYPGGSEAIERTRQRLAASVPTDAPVTQGGHKLPDGTYTPERQALHAKIVDEMFSAEQIAKATPPEGQKPVLTVLGGRGGSGKSWLTSADGPVDRDTAVLLDSDHIKSVLPGYEGWNAALYHEEATDILNLADRRAAALGLNTIHDATLKSEASIALRMASYQEAGYEVEGFYMYLGPEQAAERAMNRFSKGGTFSGRFVPPEVILGNTNNEKNFDKMSQSMRKWGVYDNSGKPPPKQVRRSWE